LQARVGGIPGYDYDLVGRGCHEAFLRAIPSTFDWRGARVLDFGSGAGRTLRHFGAEAAAAAEFWACDIDAESVEWLRANLCPPFRAFCNGELPPLQLPDSSIDLIYSMSVFTHLAETWSAWLAELHRVLAPGGLLVVTTLGPGSEADLGVPWDEERTGMLVLMPERDFVGTHGGPLVFHSEWWLREHWGRAFEIVSFEPYGFGFEAPPTPPLGQGCAVLRKRDVAVTAEELERVDDPREWAAVQHNLELVHARAAAFRELAEVRAAELDGLRRSRSWRIARAISRARRPLPPRT